MSFSDSNRKKSHPNSNLFSSDEEIHFPPYDATQLQSILSRRAEKAFHDGVVDDDVIPLCAALAAQDKGSARQAIRYLYKAGELACQQEVHVTSGHVREAEAVIERKNIEKGIRDLTTQDHLTLIALLSLAADEDTPARTKTVYAEYEPIARHLDTEPIALRRVRDHLQDLDLAGIVHGRDQSGGLKGGTYYIWELAVDIETTIDVLTTIDRYAELVRQIS